MVVHFTMRTYGVNKELRFVEGIWLHKKESPSPIFCSEMTFLHHTCATCSELPSKLSTMAYAKNHAKQKKGNFDLYSYILFLVAHTVN